MRKDDLLDSWLVIDDPRCGARSMIHDLIHHSSGRVHHQADG
jgi:hypothetical protein